MEIFYMNDNPKYCYGYFESEEDMQLASEVGIITTQEDGETRDEFFKRVGGGPTKQQYGYDMWYDAHVCNGDYYDAVSERKCLDKLFCIDDRELISLLIKNDLFLDKYIKHKDPTIRSEVYERSYGIEKAINSEKDRVAYEGIVNYLVKTDNYTDLIPVNKLNLIDIYSYFDLIHEYRNYIDDYDWLSEFYEYTYDKFGYYLEYEDSREFRELREVIRKNDEYY